ncbi:MAG: transglutaminase-like domain-containing protein [Chitinophagaceae bacterium]
MINSKHYTATENVLLEIAGFLTIIPLAPFINRYIPPILIGEWNLDLAVSIIVAFLVTRLILRLFKPLIIPALVLVLGFFGYNFFNNGYTFNNIFQDYQSVVLNNWGTKDTKQPDLLNIDPGFFQNYRDKTVRGIRSRINSKDSLVRNYSVRHSTEYFQDYFNKYGPVVRHLSLFRHINKNFNYVLDNRRDEYFASPRETILNGLGGDCDDHSILMVSCLQSIGARCRIVLVEGHAYPELYCGDKKEFELMQQAISHLFTEVDIKEFHYHENEGNYWLNLDYTARHPGGPYMNDKVYALIDL